MSMRTDFGSLSRTVFLISTNPMLSSPTWIFALTDLLDEGRERAHDYYQRYLESVARYEAEQQSSAGLEDVTPL
jgi:hypothetical protein